MKKSGNQIGGLTSTQGKVSLGAPVGTFAAIRANPIPDYIEYYLMFAIGPARGSVICGMSRRFNGQREPVQLLVDIGWSRLKVLSQTGEVIQEIPDDALTKWQLCDDGWGDLHISRVPPFSTSLKRPYYDELVLKAMAKNIEAMRERHLIIGETGRSYPGISLLIESRELKEWIRLIVTDRHQFYVRQLKAIIGLKETVGREERRAA